MMIGRRGLLAALAVLAGVAACTNSEAGTPRTATSNTATSNTAQSSTAAAPTTGTTAGEVSLPPRPRSLSLAGVDPCTVITEQQRAAFSIDRPPVASKGSSGPLKDEPGCSYNTSVGSANDWGFLIITSASVGLAEYLEQLRDDPSRRVTDVAGFPAVQQEGSTSNPATGDGVCFVYVDVADDQMLDVQFSQIGADEGKRLPIETLCAKAVEVAEAALTTLGG